MQELLEARKENSAVKSSNSQLKEELQKYKSVVQSLENQEYALQSHCSVADETKLVTSKVIQEGFASDNLTLNFMLRITQFRR